MSQVTIDTLVTDSVQKSFLAYVVWTIFDASKDTLKVRVFFFTIDISGAVRQWLIKHFGPDPLAVETIPVSS